MESVHREKCEDGGSRLGVSTIQRKMSTSELLICDETFPYVSGIFDDTIDPSFTPDHPDRSQIKTLKGPADVISGLRAKNEAAYNSWLSSPMKHYHSIDFSMSVTSPPDNCVTDVTETNPVEGAHDISSHLPQPASCSESAGLNSTKDLKEKPGLSSSIDLKEKPGLNDTKDFNENPGLNSAKHFAENPGLNATKDLIENPGINSTKDLNENPGLNSTKDLGEKSGFSSTISDPCEGAKSNTTFEKSTEQRGSSTPGSSSSVSAVDGTLEVVNEKHFNATVDISGPVNTTTEQPRTTEKLDPSADIDQSQTSVPKKLQSSEDIVTGEHCEKHSTFTKPTEETRGELTVEESGGAASLYVSPEAGEPRSANPQPVDGTFIIHNVTTDVSPTETHPSLKNAKVNTTVNVTKPTDAVELQTPSDTNVNADANAVPNDVPLNSEVPVCSNRTLDFPEAEGKEEEPRRRKNGFYEQDSCLSLDISHSSIFSMDDPLERTSRVLVTSTPIVLGRGFDMLRCAKPMEMQKRLSVINSIDAHSSNDLAGVSGSDATATNPSSIKSETCSETQKNSAKCAITNSSTSESGAAIKSPKMVLRRKIPQTGNFACKSSIPSKSQIPARPPISQGASSVVGKAKTVPAAPSAAAPSQPETSSSALHGVKRVVQLNKGKKLPPVKTITTAKNVKTSYMAASSSACTSTRGTKPSQTMAPPKPSVLQPPVRGRFGLKLPGITVFSEEAGHPQTHNRPTGLPGMRTRSSLLPAFAQKHASSEALPMAKRKRTGVQDQLSSAEPSTSSKTDEGAQSRAHKNMKPKKASHDCNTCTLLKEKLNTFHQEIGGFLQDLGKRPAGCNWLPFQSKLETCLEEFKRLQAEHH